MTTATEFVMDIGFIRPDRDPEIRQQWHRARQERAAVFSAALAAIGDAFVSGVRAALAARHRRRRRQQTFAELNGLSDRALKDIGLYRSQIHNVAEAAAAAPDVRLTLADLRRAETSHVVPPEAGYSAPVPGHARRPLPARPQPPTAPAPAALRQREAS